MTNQIRTLFSSSKKTESNINTISIVPFLDSDFHLIAKQIFYSFAECRFGKIIIASTELGICYIHFYEEEKAAISDLQKYFNAFDIIEETQEMHKLALEYISNPIQANPSLILHIKGTAFQLAVWNCLLAIPIAEKTTYNEIALLLNKANASRAVGGAVGSNPIAIIIPCHRVVQSSGKLGGYMWGLDRKKAILSFENENN